MWVFGPLRDPASFKSLVTLWALGKDRFLLDTQKGTHEADALSF